MQVHVPVVGADLLGVAVPVRVNELHAFELQERGERGFGLGAAVDPERMTDGVPGGGESLLVRVRVLDHLPLQPVRVSSDDSVAERPAVVLVVQSERVKSGLLEQALDDLGESLEGVGEVLRHVGVAEAWIVG
jgi:hypothetical protein